MGDSNTGGPAVRPSLRLRPARCLVLLPLVLTLVLGCAAGEGDPAAWARAGEPEAVTADQLDREALTVRPATTGLDSARVAATLARAETLPRLRSLLVARRGRLLVEQYYNGAQRDRPVNVKSASKSILSALAGCAIADGHLSGPEQPVAPFFEDYLGSEADPRKRSITVGDLLTMRAGLESTSGGGYGAWVQSDDWVGYVLGQRMVAPPGGRMIYSTGTSHLLSAVLTRATGQSTWQYAQECLARPLGIQIPQWLQDPQGVYFGGNDMHLTPRALVRVGELYRHEGTVDGRRVLPADWVRTTLMPRTRSPWSGFRYGYGWWLKEARGYRVFFAWGYGGQYVFVVPQLSLVVAMTSDPAPARRDGDYLDTLHALLDEGLVPAAEEGAQQSGRGGSDGA